MNRLKVMVIALLVMTGCGYSSKHNELIGQVKKITQVTPLICLKRTDVDISLGVIRNGVGSMSSEDIWMTVSSTEDIAKLKAAAENGTLVKIRYDVLRLAICQSDHTLTHVEDVK